MGAAVGPPCIHGWYFTINNNATSSSGFPKEYWCKTLYLNLPSSLLDIIIFLKQVLRDQGLGKYCDPEFVRAASREMQEAMDMTVEEFDEAAHRLLQAEQVTNQKWSQNGCSLVRVRFVFGSLGEFGITSGTTIICKILLSNLTFS